MVTYLLRASGILLILAVFATNAKACDYPVTVTDGTDCSGVLLSNDQFVEASNDKKKIRLKDIKIAEYEHLDELHEARHKIYKNELRDTKKQLKWLEIKSNFGYVISFSLGAVITGYIAKEVLD